MKQKTGILKYCQICSKEIYVRKALSERKKYCSYECRNKGLSIYNKSIGKEPPHRINTSVIKNCLVCNTEFKASQYLLKKGFGKYCSRLCAKEVTLLSTFKKGAWKFKGTRNEYRNLHKHITRKFGKPSTCEHCGKSGLKGKQIHWANKQNSDYTENREDWLRLCPKCHYIYDDRKPVTKVYNTQVEPDH